MAVTVVTLGERRFDVLDARRRTAGMDAYLIERLKSSGLFDLRPLHAEGPSEFLVRAQSQMLSSTEMLEMLACVLLPAGTAPLMWTPELATETAQYLGRLDTDDDRRAVAMLCGDFLLGWLGREIRQLGGGAQ